jgi:hypothetical protein
VFLSFHFGGLIAARAIGSQGRPREWAPSLFEDNRQVLVEKVPNRPIIRIADDHFM